VGDNLSNQSVSPSSFSFSDGVQIITNLSPNLDPLEFKFSTDATGGITQWLIDIPAEPLSSNTTAIDIHTQSISAGISDEGLQQCATNTDFQCSPEYSVSGQIGNNPGCWDGTMCAAPAPILGASIPGLLTGLGAFLFWRGRAAAVGFIRRRYRSYQFAAS
jgi:hypothetical protein